LCFLKVRVRFGKSVFVGLEGNLILGLFRHDRNRTTKKFT
jgi:hypothetical protein